MSELICLTNFKYWSADMVSNEHSDDLQPVKMYINIFFVVSVVASVNASHDVCLICQLLELFVIIQTILIQNRNTRNPIQSKYIPNLSL